MIIYVGRIYYNKHYKFDYGLCLVWQLKGNVIAKRKCYNISFQIMQENEEDHEIRWYHKVTKRNFTQKCSQKEIYSRKKNATVWKYMQNE